MKAWQPVRLVPDLLCYYELTATECFVCLFVSRGSSVNRRGSVESDLVTFSCSCRFTFLSPHILSDGKRVCFYYVISSKHPNMWL
jgi:hypothetical protein